MNGFTHNQPSFDAVVEESLLRGLSAFRTSMRWSLVEPARKRVT
jgi:hypothetical protein